jgi:cell division septum initiation protein DivIVA
MPNSVDKTPYPNLALVGTVKFRIGLKGYNVYEVDQFLSVLMVEIEALQSELEATEREVARLRAESS